MLAAWPMLTALGLGFFLIGTVVGSFLNVCIYRIPWEKSVIWPSSRCPHCWSAIAPQDNIPIVSWLALRGECRHCGAGISARYPMVETLVGLLFLGAFLLDVVAAPRGPWYQVSANELIAATYHAIFLALLVAATFIDYDTMLIPDQITVPGMVIGLAMGTIWPGVRPVPAAATTHLQGFFVGLIGLAVGAGLTQGVRASAGFVVGIFEKDREAMGLGDVTLMGMIGAFLGWQAVVLTFFVGPFFGLIPAARKLWFYLRKRFGGGQFSSSDREIPYGPYLSMAAAALLFAWPVVWRRWAAWYFHTLYVIFWWLLGFDVPD
jgi:leader peptidase (prepilin peptidase) / N-methyltransferase